MGGRKSCGDASLVKKWQSWLLPVSRGYRDVPWKVLGSGRPEGYRAAPSLGLLIGVGAMRHPVCDLPADPWVTLARHFLRTLSVEADPGGSHMQGVFEKLMGDVD